jgi:hypothetical protein
MKEPVRWRDPNGGADAETRALLSTEEAPSSSERDRIWSTLVSQLPPLPAPPPVSPVGPAAAAGTGALVGKITAGVVLVAAASMGLHAMRSRTPTAKPTPSLHAPAASSTKGTVVPPVPTELPPSPPAVSLPAAERSTLRKSRPAAPSLPKASEAESSPVVSPKVAPQVIGNELLEEGRRLSRARAALRAHDPERALELLQTGAAGTGALAQEREALTIEALASRPKSRTQAAARARAFMVAYPESPYRARIKAIALESW